MVACLEREKVQLESVVIWSAGDNEPIPEKNRVRFRLLYAGNELVSNGDPSQKHVLRKKFHPQLKALWETHPHLSRMALRYGASIRASKNNKDMMDYENDSDGARRMYYAELGAKYARGNFNFVPLIEPDTPMRVSIDILFLRRDQQPLIKQGGDIDNRLKTLFDALRVPDTTNGLGGVPAKDEDPFFVLLQDDSMISDVRVSTDNLLLLPELAAPDAKDAFLVIDVDLRPTQSTVKSWVFE